MEDPATTPPTGDLGRTAHLLGDTASLACRESPPEFGDIGAGPEADTHASNALDARRRDLGLANQSLQSRLLDPEARSDLSG